MKVQETAEFNMRRLDYQSNSKKKVFRVLSLGAGVQSTVLSLLADMSFLPDLHLAIFADTGDECQETYDMVEFLQSYLSYPVKIVKSHFGDLSMTNLKKAKKGDYLDIPFYLENGSLGRRQCTNHWKLQPIIQAQRSALGIIPKAHFPTKDVIIEKWLGLSVDEIFRLKDSRLKYEKVRAPLIDMNWSRQDCINWWKEHKPKGAPKLARSACFYCPFKTNSEWLSMKKEDQQRAIRFEARINFYRKQTGHERVFLHQDKIPLKKALEKMNKNGHDPKEAFAEECEGMCGV